MPEGVALEPGAWVAEKAIVLASQPDDERDDKGPGRRRKEASVARDLALLADAEFDRERDEGHHSEGRRAVAMYQLDCEEHRVQEEVRNPPIPSPRQRTSA